jgi:hypothetical protein
VHGSDSRKIFAHEYIDDRSYTEFKFPSVKKEKKEIDDDTLNELENIFGFSFYTWQRLYLKGEGSLWFGRQTGKTFAYCLKLLLEDRDPFDLNNPSEIAKMIDEPLGLYYVYHFRALLSKMNTQLIEAGFDTNVK